MRIIKFQAFHKKERKMCRVVETDFIDMVTVRFPEFEGDSFGNEYNDTMTLDEFESLLQYTGAVDSNNQALFEGDICTFRSTLIETLPTFKGVIEWDKYRFCIRNLDYDVKLRQPFATPYMDFDLFGVDCEKIGSIYETPELLPSV